MLNVLELLRKFGEFWVCQKASSLSNNNENIIILQATQILLTVNPINEIVNVANAKRICQGNKL